MDTSTKFNLSFFKKLDGRWFLGGSHITLLLISYFFFSLQRSIFQICSAYVAALICEYVFFKFSQKNKHRRLIDSLFSATTEAAGLLILVRSSFQWTYVVFSVLAVSSKYLLLLDKKRHFFNPTNFAIVAGLTFMPREYFEVRGDDFNISFYPMMHVLLFGLAAVYLGKTWRVTLAYFITIVLMSFLLSLQSGDSIIYYLGPEVGAIGLIFMFLMITDPRTTPASSRGQLFFGFLVAATLYVFRSFEMFYSHFFSLFIVTLFRGLYELKIKNARVSTGVLH